MHPLIIELRENLASSKACRYQTMHVLANVVKKYPEFASELRVSIQSQMPLQNHVFRHFATKLLTQLDTQ